MQKLEVTLICAKNYELKELKTKLIKQWGILLKLAINKDPSNTNKKKLLRALKRFIEILRVISYTFLNYRKTRSPYLLCQFEVFVYLVFIMNFTTILLIRERRYQIGKAVLRVLLFFLIYNICFPLELFMFFRHGIDGSGITAPRS